MAKSFKDYFGDFNSARDKLLFAIGEIAQVPQRATNLMPRLESFANSDDPKLQEVGMKLVARNMAVRDSARMEFDNAQALSFQMVDLKNKLEGHAAYQELMTQSGTSLIITLISKSAASDEDARFLQASTLELIKLAGKAGAAIIRLNALTDEIKEIERLAQETADYAAGKGILPVLPDPGQKNYKSLFIGAGTLAAVGLGFLFSKRR